MILIDTRDRAFHVIYFIVSVLGFASLFCGSARASTCADIVPGAKPGSLYTAEDGVTPEFSAKYANACIVRWGSGARGAAGSAADNEKCKTMSDADMLEFVPDQGSNYNTCVFRPADSSEKSTADDEDDAPSKTRVGAGDSSAPKRAGSTPRRTITAQDPAKDYGSYTFKLCNETGEPSLDIAIGTYANPEDDKIKVTLEGWWQIQNGKCLTVSRSLGHNASSLFYFHAENSRFSWWNVNAGQENFCIDRSKTFTRVNAAGYRCQGNEKLAGFGRVTVQPGDNVYYLRR